MSRKFIVVGNLIGDATVAVAPRAAGRLRGRLRPPRRPRDPRPAHRQDRGLRAPGAGQAGGSGAGSLARHHPPARGRPEARRTNAERSRNLFDGSCCRSRRSTTPRRATRRPWRSSTSRARRTRSRTRGSTSCASISRTPSSSPRSTASSPGAPPTRARSSSQNAPVVDVVDISRVRLVANVVEKDLKSCRRATPRRSKSTLSGRDLHRPDRARRAGARPGDAHGADRDRDPESRLPLEAGHVCARERHHRRAARTRSWCRRMRSSTRRPARRVPRGRTAPRSFRAVRSASRAGHSIEILGGLTEGDQRRHDGRAGLRDGDRVHPCRRRRARATARGAASATRAGRRRRRGRRRRQVDATVAPAVGRRAARRRADGQRSRYSRSGQLRTSRQE